MIIWDFLRTSPSGASISSASAVGLLGHGYLLARRGGAAIAVLLAARRHDVVNLRTVAGNLDHESVNRYHGVSEMPEALNPINFSTLIERLPQRHFVGGKDTVILPSVVEGFLAQQHEACGHISFISDASHLDGWIGRWVELLSIPVACS